MRMMETDHSGAAAEDAETAVCPVGQFTAAPPRSPTETLSCFVAFSNLSLVFVLLGPFLTAFRCSVHRRRGRLRLGRCFLPPSASSTDSIFRRGPSYLHDDSGGGPTAVRMLVVRPRAGRGWFDRVPSLGEYLVQLLEERFQRSGRCGGWGWPGNGSGGRGLAWC